MMKKEREKMRMRIKIAHDLTKFFHIPIREKYVSRSIIKFAYPSIHHITTHMHILI
jgi:DNA-binding XRE family transcriptional regulator